MPAWTATQTFTDKTVSQQEHERCGSQVISCHVNQNEINHAYCQKLGMFEITLPGESGICVNCRNIRYKTVPEGKQQLCWNVSGCGGHFVHCGIVQGLAAALSACSDC